MSNYLLSHEMPSDACGLPVYYRGVQIGEAVIDRWVEPIVSMLGRWVWSPPEMVRNRKMLYSGPPYVCIKVEREDKIADFNLRLTRVVAAAMKIDVGRLQEIYNQTGRNGVRELLFWTAERMSKIQMKKTTLPIEWELDCRSCLIDKDHGQVIIRPAPLGAVEEAVPVVEFQQPVEEEERAIAERLAKLQETAKPLTMDRLQNMFRPGSAPTKRDQEGEQRENEQ